MPLYQYKARDVQSATARGRREAVSPDELAALLRQEGAFSGELPGGRRGRQERL